MIRKTLFFEKIENYCLGQLSEKEKSEFEDELKFDSEINQEIELHKDIITALSEKDVLDLREKLKNLSEDSKINVKEAPVFKPFNQLDDLDEITELLSENDLIDYFDSLPKVHVYHHGATSKQNTHQFYKEQLESNISDLSNSDSIGGFDFAGFEGIEEAILEKDIINLRDTMSQIAKSVLLQYSTEEIDKYLNGDLSGKELEMFEIELKQNRSLRDEVRQHSEIADAILEVDVRNLRKQLTNIMESETSWSVSEQNIEEFIDGILEGELLHDFNVEMNENADLRSEISLRRMVNEAVGEKDILNFREKLKSARDEAEETDVKSIVLGTTINSRILKIWKQSAAVVILLIGITAILNTGINSFDKTYNAFYNTPEWSPERTVSAIEMDVLHEANVYYMNGKYEEAIALYDRGLKEENEKFVFHFYKGASLQGMNKLQEAIPEYSEVIKHGDNMYIQEAEWNKSLCYLKLGQKEVARLQLLAIVDRNGFYKKDAVKVLRRIKYSLK